MAFKQQFIPLLLTVVTFCVLCIALYFYLHLLNFAPVKDKIQFLFRPVDIIIGMTIYLKTSIDFALFMGNLMAANSGWTKRIAIEFGTALGNALGTFFVLAIWFFFKEAPILMMIMIVLAAIVLFEMAKEGFEEIGEKKARFKKFLHFPIATLSYTTLPFRPLIKRVLPEKGIHATKLSFTALFFFSITIPFVLGLDDFAGYIPLFSVVNVMSFIVGVFFAHMLLNIGLFASPATTIKITRSPFVIIFGSVAFIGIGVWGIIEAVQIGLELVLH